LKIYNQTIYKLYNLHHIEDINNMIILYYKASWYYCCKYYETYNKVIV